MDTSGPALPSFRQFAPKLNLNTPNAFMPPGG
jgi:hypothetical protein